MLINVVGLRCYTSAMEQLLGLLASRTMLLQLVYGLLQALLVRLCPELAPRLAALKPRPPARPTVSGRGVGTGAGPLAALPPAAARSGGTGA